MTNASALVERAGSTYGGPTRAMLEELASDLQAHSLRWAFGHAARKTRVYGVAETFRGLAAMPAYQYHVATTGGSRLFFLSDRHYLVKGLTTRQRLESAVAHYSNESKTFDDDYIRKVYRDGGLELWRTVVAGVTYVIRLFASNDVLHEGALSIEMRVDDGRVCMLCYSIVPTDVVLPGHPLEGTDSVIFLTRKHLASDHGYQSQFNKAFDRTTPTHLCFGALTGIALSQGRHHVLGIEPTRHPAFQSHFIAAYADFWVSMFGRRVSAYGYLMNLPVQQTPLDQLDASRRKRAVLRRKHAEAVQESAEAVIAKMLRRPLAVRADSALPASSTSESPEPTRAD